MAAKAAWGVSLAPLLLGLRYANNHTRVYNAFRPHWDEAASPPSWGARAVWGLGEGEGGLKGGGGKGMANHLSFSLADA